MWQKCWNTNQSLVHNLRFRERGPLKSWRPETMAEAIFSVLKEGLSLSQAARKFDIPYPTFVLYANRVHNMLGPSADGGAGWCRTANDLSAPRVRTLYSNAFFSARFTTEGPGTAAKNSSGRLARRTYPGRNTRGGIQGPTTHEGGSAYRISPIAGEYCEPDGF